MHTPRSTFSRSVWPFCLASLLAWGFLARSVPPQARHLAEQPDVMLAETCVVDRVYGPSRIDTAIEISKVLYPGGAPAVILATGQKHVDALTGGPLSALVDGPLLLTSGGRLTTSVLAEVDRLSPTRAFILGGTVVVPEEVVSQLESLGVPEVIRLGGGDRFETAALIAHQMRLEGAESSEALVVDGDAWPDAVSGSVLAAVGHFPVVLADDEGLPQSSQGVLEEWGTESTIVVGGPVVVPDAVLAGLPDPERLGGSDRYATARLVAEYGEGRAVFSGSALVASGEAFPDALSGVALAARRSSPTLLSRSVTLPDPSEEYLAERSEELSQVTLLGGYLALSAGVECEVRQALGLPCGTPWPEVTSTVRVFSDQVSESITDAQVQFVAENYVGSQKQTVSFVRRLRAYDPGYLVLHYRLGLGLGYRSGDSWVRIIEGDDWVVEWPDWTEDSWFYLYGGERVLQTQWHWYLMDVDDSSWRSWWSTEVARQIAANEDDGLFIDSYSVPNYLGGSNYDPALPDYDPGFESEWTARIDRYSAYLTSQPALRPVIANAGYWVTSRDSVDYGILDGVMIEGMGEWGPDSPFDEADWVLQQNRVLGLANADKIVIAQSYLYSPSDAVTRRVATASYLLSRGPQSYLCLEMDASPEWFPEYGLDMGAPVDALPVTIAEYRLSSGLYRRRFEQGVVLMNPTGSAIGVSVALVAGAGEWDIATFVGGGALPADADVSEMSIVRAPASFVTVPAHDAVFLLGR